MNYGNGDSMGWSVVKSKLEMEDKRQLAQGSAEISNVERTLAQSLDISQRSFGENEYWDGYDWDWERNLASTLSISEASYGEDEYWDSNDWDYERRVLAQVDPVDLDDLGDWYSDYER